MLSTAVVIGTLRVNLHVFSDDAFSNKEDDVSLENFAHPDVMKVSLLKSLDVKPVTKFIVLIKALCQNIINRVTIQSM